MMSSNDYKRLGIALMCAGAYVLGVATGRLINEGKQEVVKIEDAMVESAPENYAIDIKDLPEGAYVSGYDKYGNPLYNDADHEQIIEGYEEVIEDENVLN